MCLSAITWSGFDNFYYLFSHEDSRDEFAIPHDLKILKEVFDVMPGQYQRNNAFWHSYSIRALATQLPEPEKSDCQRRLDSVITQYEALSAQYQSGKQGNSIPLN